MSNQIGSLKMGQKFKKTPAGEIPVDWEAIRLGDIAKLEYGDSLKEDKRMGGKVPVYGSNGIVGYHSSALIKGPGIVIGRKGTVGAVVWSDKDLWPIDTTYYVNTHREVSFKWLYYILNNLHLENLSLSSGVPGLNREQVHDLYIPLPLKTEQNKISHILTTVDGLIDKVAAEIEKTKELKKGLMRQLLTSGIGHKKFRKTILGQIPAEWDVMRLGDLCIGRPEYGANVAGRDFLEGLPRYIRITDILDDGSLIEVDQKGISNADAEPYLLTEGDVLFARSGATVGKTYLYRKTDGFCAFAGYLIRFRLDSKKMLPEYLSQFTHSEAYYNWVKGMLRAGAQPNINATEYANMQIPVPGIEEQKNILSVLSGVDFEISHGQRYKHHIEKIKTGLINMLLTGKVRV